MALPHPPKKQQHKLLDYSCVIANTDYLQITSGTLFTVWSLFTLAPFTIYSCIFYQGCHVNEGVLYTKPCATK